MTIGRSISILNQGNFHRIDCPATLIFSQLHLSGSQSPLKLKFRRLYMPSYRRISLAGQSATIFQTELLRIGQGAAQSVTIL
jgi:hypothetical protein